MHSRLFSEVCTLQSVCLALIALREETSVCGQSTVLIQCYKVICLMSLFPLVALLNKITLPEESTLCCECINHDFCCTSYS